jgi:CSLREA domain-containing protein
MLDGTSYVVDSIADIVASDDMVTLREAIEAANSNSAVTDDVLAGSETETDLITFDQAALSAQAGVAIGEEVTILLAGAQLEVTGDLDIQGLGDDVLTIDAGGASRVMRVTGTDVEASLAGLKLTHGYLFERRGAGIWNDGATLTLTDCTVSDNLSDYENIFYPNFVGSAGALSSVPGDDAESYGGGIYNGGGSLTLTGCAVTGNEAESAGGVDNDGGTLTVTTSTVIGNSGDSWAGGIRCVSGALTVTDSILSDNGASSGGGIYAEDSTVAVSGSTISDGWASCGGGIYIRNATLTLTGSTISDNIAGGNGGAIENVGGTLAIYDSTISGNSANYGAGIHSYHGYLTLTDTTLSDNSAETGGGMYNSWDYTVTLTNTRVTGNSSELSAAGLFIFHGEMTLTNTLVAGNRANTDGGGVRNSSDTMTLTNSTVAGNSAVSNGGGIFNYGTTSLMLNNTIVSMNDATNGTDIEGDYTSQSSLVGEDPGFVRNPSPGLDGIWGTGDDDPGDLHLSWPTSPVLDAGDNALLPVDEYDLDHDGNTAEPLPIDLEGNRRAADANFDTLAVVDIGAYEYELKGTAYVVDSLADVVDSDGVVTLREAIEAANTNSAVTDDVLAGSLLAADRITFDQAALEEEAGSGNRLVIALDGSELEINGDLDIQGLGDEVLTIDAEGADRVIYVRGDDTVASLSGLSITGAVRDSGIQNFQSLLTVTDCSVWGNTDTGSGGGIGNSGGTLTVIDSTVSGNVAEFKGGGIYNQYGSLVVINSVVSGNTAHTGGGIQNGWEGTCTIVNSTVAGNYASSAGGGVANDDGELVLNNSIVTANEARTGSNVFEDLSGYDEGEDEPFTNNSSLIGVDAGFVRAPSPGSDGQWGTQDDDWGDLHLRESSLAINLGDDAIALGVDGYPLMGDRDGSPRRVHGQVDIGAYEYQSAASPDWETPSAQVTTTADVVEKTDGEISLREACVYGALLEQTVALAESLGGWATIHLGGQELCVSQALTIEASSDEHLRIDAGGQSRVMYVAGGASVSLIGVELTGGATTADAPGDGGGIYSQYSTLTLTNSTVSENSTSGGSGGGIYNDHGTLILEDSTVKGNNAAVEGGGIFTYAGTTRLLGSRVSDNRAGGDGGGISSVAQGETVLVDSIVSGNVSSMLGGLMGGQGGGIYAAWPLTVVNSVVTGNMCLGSFGGGAGGGIYAGGTLTMTNSTVSGNWAGSSGGIRGTFAVTLNNTIVALNHASSYPDINDDGELTAYSSLVGEDPGFVEDPSAGWDGAWGTEDDNPGDPHLTAGSPAVDAGNDFLALDPDGLPLTIDLDGRPRFMGLSVDIGAYEYPSPSEVVARHIFYNQCCLDGGELGAGPADDNAIDTTKEALLPGETPDPANWTAYRSGINGIMIDVRNLPEGVPLTNEDFELLESDGGSWGPAQQPWSIDVRRGAGEDGSDRVTLVWSDLAVRSGWLCVRMLPTMRTALPDADVFAFANLPGDANGDGAVTDADYTIWADHYDQTGTETTHGGDFNLDGRVSDADYTTWAEGYGQTVPAPPAMAAAEALGEDTSAESVWAMTDADHTIWADHYGNPTGLVSTPSEPRDATAPTAPEADAEDPDPAPVKSAPARGIMGPLPLDANPVDVTTYPGPYSLHEDTVGQGLAAEEPVDLLAILSSRVAEVRSVA